MEESVDELKNRLLSNTGKHKSENISLMQKNMLLIKEVTELRTHIEELKKTRKRREIFGMDIEMYFFL